MLQTCPPEILHLIFTLACTDGGPTARALATTSKYLSAVSAPFLYHVLSLEGVHQINRAYNRLSTLPCERRRVEHLFLTDKPTFDPIRDGTEQLFHGKVPNEHLFKPLLALVAPTLRTFTCLIYDMPASAIDTILSTHFPVLTELSLALHNQRISYHMVQPGVLTMPHLERLHFSSTHFFSSSAAPLLARVAPLAPRLSHVRFYGVLLMPGCSAVLCRMLGRLPIRDQYGWVPPDSLLDKVCRLPFSVRQVELQLACLPSTDGQPYGFEVDLVRRMATMHYADGLS
ncbi:hypothetical protein BV25DRAFT_344520 [Artomyces pyxidatus]|uniref:Uncharacterized protein n=1 Tax=Artomyces pyxidatus TaxID=48021 RepID=A0ACB8T7J6_9AGAM|nr:hypothetical protein BV25DRAFT_344520 [Artomyces pyxidatus]